jgi:hypothetical protein
MNQQNPPRTRRKPTHAKIFRKRNKWTVSLPSVFYLVVLYFNPFEKVYIGMYIVTTKA